MQTLDPKKNILIVGGVPLTGYAKGTFIEAEFESDAVSDEVGADGTVARMISADLRGTFRVTLMRNSESNDYLSGLAKLDRLTGAGVVPCEYQDLTGTTLASAVEAWVKKIPAAQAATEITTNKWEIRCGQLDETLGGTAVT